MSEQNQSKTPNKKVPKTDALRMPLLFRCLLILLLVLSFVFFATKLMEYNRRMQELEKLNEEIREHESNVEELKYLIDSPVDDEYIIRVAREKLGLVFPDEEVFYSNLTPDK